MPEYAFDVTLYAVARVTADNEDAARRKMRDVIDCIDLNYDQDDVKLTEATIDAAHDAVLFDANAAPTFYRCGICDCYHSIKWNGDCRQDDARFACDELDDKYGRHGWSEVEMPS